MLSRLNRLSKLIRFSCLTAHPFATSYFTPYYLLLTILLLPTYSLLLPRLLLTTQLLTPYYSPTYSLLIKRFLKGAELIFTFYATSPPCLKESEAITHQLGKGCSHTKQGNMQAAKHDKRMHEEG